MIATTDTETAVATVVTVVVIVIAWETAMETDTVTVIASVIGMAAAAVAVTIMPASDTARMNLARMTPDLGEDTRHWTSSKVSSLCPTAGGYH